MATIETTENIEKQLSDAFKPLETIKKIANPMIKMANIGGQAAIDVLSLSDQMTNTTARLNFMNDGLQTTEELQQMIFQSAERSRTSYMSTANVVAQLSQQAPDAFASNKETIAFAENLNKMFIIANASQQEIDSASTQLAQALGSGVLQVEELNEVFKVAPNVIQTIADYLEVPIEQIQNLASNGEITSEIVKNAMLAATDTINSQFAEMPLTFAQIWTNFKDSALGAFQPVLERIGDIANNEKFQSMVSSVISFLHILAAVAMWVFEIISSVAGFMYDNWSILGPIIVGVVGSLLTLIASLAIVEAATIAYAVAQQFLSAAMANTIGLILAGLVLLFGLFYAVIGAINHFAGTSFSATGMIAGAFAVMGAFIANVFFGLLQIVFSIVERLYNSWIAFANFFGNVFNDPIAAIIHLFGDLADNVLGVIERIAGALDFVFGTNLASTIAGWRSELAGLVNWAAEEFGNGTYEALYDELDMDNVLAELGVSLDRFEYGDAWNAGHDWGANLFKNDPRETQKENPYDGDILNGFQGSLEPLSNDGNKTAGNTAKMAESMEASEEDLKYLRDLAERDVINRFTTAEINVDFSSTNTINSELDLDGIIDRFTEKLEEAIDVAAEGV